MSKKVNPRRRPATAADVQRAVDVATERAMNHILALVLYVLVDKHGAPREELQQLAKEIDDAAEAVKEGYVSWADIKHVLVGEYDIHIKLE